jgi:hypothetical protein
MTVGGIDFIAVHRKNLELLMHTFPTRVTKDFRHRFSAIAHMSFHHHDMPIVKYGELLAIGYRNACLI